MSDKTAANPRTSSMALAGVVAFAAGVGTGTLIRPNAEAQPVAERALVEIPFADAVMEVEDVLTTATIVQRTLFVLNPETGEREEVLDDMVIYLPLFNDDRTTMTKRRFQFKPGVELDQETGRTFMEVTPTPTPGG